MRKKIHKFPLTFYDSNGTEATTITGSSYVVSQSIQLYDMLFEGYFALETTHAGAGSTVTATVEVSSDGTNFRAPETAVTIWSSVAVGTHSEGFDPPLTMFFRVRLTETAGSNVTSVTGKVFIQ